MILTDLLQIALLVGLYVLKRHIITFYLFFISLECWQQYYYMLYFAHFQMCGSINHDICCVYITIVLNTLPVIFQQNFINGSQSFGGTSNHTLQLLLHFLQLDSDLWNKTITCRSGLLTQF